MTEPSDPSVPPAPTISSVPFVPSVPGKKAFLYVVGCASGIAGEVGTLIAAARQRGRGVGMVATPQALGFLCVASDVRVL
ncbi:hypothetical protein [Streptomyces prasinus]|uniref:hypothetical protein n=1 Tax=Streptomyces prasinus TaxID=67345 RepID=UPI0033F52FAE